MAVKRTKAVEEKIEQETVVLGADSKGRGGFRMPKWAIWLLIVIAGLVAYWYKTGEWPVVAMVGTRPVTRYEIQKSLFAKGGKAEVENKITELEVALELKKLGISVTDAEVDAKINEIKVGLGEGADIEALLAARGMSLDEYRKQLKLLMGAEKAVASTVQVTDEDVRQYLMVTGGSATDAAQLQNAKESVRLSKVDVEIDAWVSGLKDKYKIWKIPGL